MEKNRSSYTGGNRPAATGGEMSERRLRELGTFDTEGGVERCAFCHVLVSAGEHYPQCPMDADPDVVRVLRDKLWPMVHVLGTGNAHWAKRVVAQEIIH